MVFQLPTVLESPVKEQKPFGKSAKMRNLTQQLTAVVCNSGSCNAQAFFVHLNQGQ